MAIVYLHAKGKIKTTGKVWDGVYFKMTDNKRVLVDKMAEEICLAKRFLSLASDDLHYKSNQELKNGMVTGEN